ncbi:DNA-nicking Smr family endonuclease [Rhodovulum bhavnagarense]|uniref:DNA-nicking Smr family endonuclease n=1 Tax=Rhodovulum bhavnagarense TaxID=992286 RepID=A0A4R2RMZ9_9RHOB|nr:Smr/MutS family protein [Rhodovulum bhavnagarense]TCP61141.1 DNA-nicking Smr family endonuclease [Rhodovulum bhavnagarense]
MTRRRKHLSPEDRALWDHVARQVQPLHPRRPVAVTDVEKGLPRPSPPEMPRVAFTIGARAAGPDADKAAPAPTVRMDHKAYNRLRAGKLRPEARIDLHGMTLAQAHPALTRFILDSQAHGRRLVLVITGKGSSAADDGPIPERRGVLRRQVPHWLGQPPLAAAVLQTSAAHRRHGGEGALYVYLRKLK